MMSPTRKHSEFRSYGLGVKSWITSARPMKEARRPSREWVLRLARLLERFFFVAESDLLELLLLMTLFAVVTVGWFKYCSAVSSSSILLLYKLNNAFIKQN
jgi:hypothetical protein